MTEASQKATMMRDIALGLATAISVATMVMTLVDRTTSAAQSTEILAGRVRAMETRGEQHEAILKARARFVNDATNQLNYLCTATKGCRTFYPQPIAVPE